MSLPADSKPSQIDWRLDDIVASLRQLRDASLAARQRLGCPAKLPSRRALENIIDTVCAAMFPNRLSARELGEKGVDFFVGNTLDRALRELVEQVAQEYRFIHEGVDDADDVQQNATQLAGKFAAGLPEIRALLDTDIHAAYESDPAARSVDEVLACYPGMRAVMHHRIAHLLHTLGARLIARMISEIAHSATGVEIHPGARIGRSFFIDHGTGVVIGETAVIGDRVRLHHAVTLGAPRLAPHEKQEVDHLAPRHPIVEDDVTIYAGATLLGPIRIGRGAVIGGNVWLTTSVAAGSNISQAAVRTEAFDEGLGI
jgi:serine O-acetyltransferase